MSATNAELELLLSKVHAKDRRARTLYWVYTVIALVAGTAWLAYSFYEVGKLRKQSESLKSQIERQAVDLDNIKKDVKARKDELETISQSLRIPLEDLQNLNNYGFLTGDQTSANLHSYVEQTTKAKEELQNIKSVEKTRRANISIRYYIRENDKGRVTVAMENLHNDYGFRIVANAFQKEPNTFTNAVWINRNVVTDEDVKLVAYYLILRGIELKYIGPPSSKAGIVNRLIPEAIVVVAEPKAKDEPPLTVERIKSLSLASLRQGTKTLDW